MRLVCPNCSAQYEIEATMIPEDGRDVQCSNCGHTWFELPGPQATEEADSSFAPEETAPDLQDDLTSASTEDVDDEDLVVGTDDDAASEDDAEEFFQNEDIFEVEDEEDGEDEPASDRRESHPSYLTRAEFEDEQSPTSDEGADGQVEDEQDEPGAEEDTPDTDRSEPASEAIRAITAASDDTNRSDDDYEEDEPADLTSAPAPRRPADAAALDILREEAEREMSRRRAPPSETIETQTDLGLEDIRNRRTPSRALRARMAHLGEEMPEVEEHKPEKTKRAQPVISRPSEPEGPYEEPRRDLLPDIEEINSTLKPAPSRSQLAESRKRSGFRMGFLGMVFAAFAIVIAYAQAPAIARALPEAEPTVIAFVDKANGVRDWIDKLVRQ